MRGCSFARPTSCTSPIADPEPDMLDNKPIETKAHGGDVAGAFDDFMRAFESFKDTNDERLGRPRAPFGADVVTTEKARPHRPRARRASPRRRRPRAEGRRARRWAATALSRTPTPTPAQGGVRRLRSQRRRRPARANSSRRRCPPAPIPTAATSCPTRPSAPSTAR